MNRRFLKIKNFKNIGLEKDSGLETYFNLNNSFDPKAIGELIIVVGENNSGKSNVLTALKRIADKKIIQDDIPDFNDYDGIYPEISLVYRENEYKDENGKFKGNDTVVTFKLNENNETIIKKNR